MGGGTDFLVDVLLLTLPDFGPVFLLVGDGATTLLLLTFLSPPPRCEVEEDAERALLSRRPSRSRRCNMRRSGTADIRMLPLFGSYLIPAGRLDGMSCSVPFHVSHRVERRGGWFVVWSEAGTC